MKNRKAILRHPYLTKGGKAIDSSYTKAGRDFPSKKRQNKRGKNRSLRLLLNVGGFYRKNWKSRKFSSLRETRLAMFGEGCLRNHDQFYRETSLKLFFCWCCTTPGMFHCGRLLSLSDHFVSDMDMKKTSGFHWSDNALHKYTMIDCKSTT